ncbi:hypothetical protein EJ06DRAFT_528185 [Trichodelitschia bisporula]|uniref:Transcription initiation factor IIE subunit alpha N-terminal domain-containing protein n=1 Tax=Trichodelitschia bisporula TaxID=703511 RepID=A0A6G1I596_9PEZI|nr:hypothetical protein EJ06DRAFT_528185 [Trichodelitschia bisporula]
MEKAHILARMTARAFYDMDHVVVVDALATHISMPIEDLRQVFTNTGKNKQDIQKLCGRLREGGLVSVYTRQETKAGAQKPTAVEYYYVDPRRAVDATKYRLHMVEEQLRKIARPTTEKKEFSCPRCKAEWTQMDVLDSVDPAGRGSGFVCKRCSTVLDYHPNDPETEEADGPLGQFNKQLGWLIQLLREVDNTTVPELTGEAALEAQRPIPREATYDFAHNFETAAPAKRPSAVKGMATAPAKIEVKITTDQERSAAQQAAAAEEKAKLAHQNQLPAWHTQSTVSKEAAATGNHAQPSRSEETLAPLGSGEPEEKKPGGNDLFDSYFQALEEERRALAQQRNEDEEMEDEDEDEEEEFEDVPTESLAVKRPKLEASTPADDSATTTPAAPPQEDSEEEFEDVA